MNINRRTFATGVLTTGGGVGLLHAATPAAARAASPVSMPSFANRPKAEFPGGWIKETTTADAPQIPNMASSYVSMNPGALRGLHWHKSAAEFGYVVSGACVLTVIDPDLHSGIQELRAGDIWYVPLGFGHGQWAFSDEGCIFCTVYDDGVTSELNALEIADLIRTERGEIVGSVLGLQAQELADAVKGIARLAPGAPGDPRMAAKPFGELAPAPNPFGFRLMGLPSMRSPGGWFVQASRSDFPMSLTLVGAITHLDADGIREPHWHPNADEWDLVLQGRAIITFFDGPDNVQAIEVGPGDIGFLPRNQAHAVATVGGEPFLLLSVFNASEFLSIGLSEALAGLPEPLLARNLGLPPDSIARLPKGERFIVRRA